MSKVITVLDYTTQRVYMMGDKRAIRRGVINDDYIKVFAIKDNLFLGITGIAEYGELLHD